MNKHVQLTESLFNQLTRYFGVIYEGRTARQLRTQIDTDSFIRYGRFRLAGDGDSFRTADLVARDPIARDNSYVKVGQYLLLVSL